MEITCCAHFQFSLSIDSKLAVEGLTKQMHFVQSHQRDLVKPSTRLSSFPAYFKISQHFQIARKMKTYVSLCYILF